MKDESRLWLKYANENLNSAHILLKHDLLNPCLQNIQQSIEKSLKALLVELSLDFPNTHSINELRMLLSEALIDVDIPEDACDLIDSIYLPSNYPLVDIFPLFKPDIQMCRQCITIAERVQGMVELKIKGLKKARNSTREIEQDSEGRG
jgi:HEPN domain-containing protein